MVTVDPISLAARRKEIAEQIARLKQEGDELDIALRVLERYGAASSKGTEYRASAAEVEATAAAVNGAPRPSGTPTNFEMLQFVLASAEKEGRDGLTANEVVEAIRERYWPGLTSHQILPSIYGFKKAGRVKKTAAGKFKRIKKSEGPEAETAEPS